MTSEEISPYADFLTFSEEIYSALEDIKLVIVAGMLFSISAIILSSNKYLQIPDNWLTGFYIICFLTLIYIFYGGYN